MKKKILILFVIVFAIVGCFIVLLLVRHGSSEKHKDKKEDVLINENVSLLLNGELPTFYDFVNNKEISGDLEIYYEDELFQENYLNKTGEYRAKLKFNGEEKEVTFQVYDREAPVLTLKDLTITEGQEYTADMFLDKCSDNSGEKCLLELSNQETYKTAGTYNITVLGKDPSGNVVEVDTKLTILKEKPKKIETKKEVTTETSQIKYGLTQISTITKTYDLYSDGSIKNEKTKISNKYDYSTYNAKAKDLLSEARENVTKYDSQVQEILKYTNAYRAEVGAQALTLDNELTLEAMVRIIESAYTNRMNHTRPDGGTCFEISSELGMKEFWGENLAYGQSNAKGATTWWRNSSGHYANMISTRYTKLGVGVLRFNNKNYYIQVFA